jgi:hypothetical protein
MVKFLCFRFITFLSLVVTSGSVQAQCPSDKGQLEIAASYGTVTGDQVSIGAAENNKGLTYHSGASSVTARYFMFSCLAFGFSGGIVQEKGRYNDAFHPSVITSTYSQSSTTIALEGYYVYFFRKYLEVYTLLGFGPSFTTVTTVTNPTLYTAGFTTTASHDGLKMQYDPIGVRVGGRLGGFVEAGFGYKGLVNAGISYKLGPSCWWKE